MQTFISKGSGLSVLAVQCETSQPRAWMHGWLVVVENQA